mmetsp:Transcript_10031/g.35131  ORF Transcript_10031/g.35131 Transcript_10031/m.35131 type:complete len:222 (-) Transcript_10031:383-1048(-)
MTTTTTRSPGCPRPPRMRPLLTPLPPRHRPPRWVGLMLAVEALVGAVAARTVAARTGRRPAGTASMRASALPDSPRRALVTTVATRGYQVAMAWVMGPRDHRHRQGVATLSGRRAQRRLPHTTDSTLVVATQRCRPGRLALPAIPIRSSDAASPSPLRPLPLRSVVSTTLVLSLVAASQRIPLARSVLLRLRSRTRLLLRHHRRHRLLRPIRIRLARWHHR